MDKFTKIIPLSKVEEQSDGTLHVYGVVTAEQPDRTNEVCDYEKTVPYYKARAEEQIKKTSIDGMEQSCMPLREMHALIACGKGISMDFDPVAKTIRMGFEVVAAETIKKVKKGVLPAFSQGGDYVEKWADPVFKGCTRYVADPGEVSLVDRGALPAAVIDAIKGQSFQFVKADGSIELVKMDLDSPKRNFTDADAEQIADILRKKLAKEEKTKRKGGKDLSASDFAYVGDPEDTSTWKLPIHDAAHARNALARFNQTEGIPADEKKKVKAKIVAAAHKFGIKVGDEAEKIKKAIDYLDAAVNGKPLEKGLYDVSQMAQVLETIHWMQVGAVYEREAEGDTSTQPEDFGQLLEDAILLFHSMVEEETSELAEHAAAISGRGNKAMTNEELTKVANELLAKAKGATAHLKELHAMHKTFHAKMHKAHTAHMEEAHASIEKCMKAMGGDTKEFDAQGEGPDAAGITASSDGESGHMSDTGSAAPHAKGNFISMGKNDKGVEMYKFVPLDPMTEIRDMLKGMPELIEKKVDEGLTAMAKAMFDTDGTTPAATGVGDRSLVRGGGPAQTQPVGKTLVSAGKDAEGNDLFKLVSAPAGKTSDAANGGPGAPGNTAPKKTYTADEQRDLVIKANNGDTEAKLELARMIKVMSPEEGNRVQEHVSQLTLRH